MGTKVQIHIKQYLKSEKLEKYDSIFITTFVYVIFFSGLYKLFCFLKGFIII